MSPGFEVGLTRILACHPAIGISLGTVTNRLGLATMFCLRKFYCYLVCIGLTGVLTWIDDRAATSLSVTGYDRNLDTVLVPCIQVERLVQPDDEILAGRSLLKSEPVFGSVC